MEEKRDEEEVVGILVKERGKSVLYVKCAMSRRQGENKKRFGEVFEYCNV